MTQNSNPTTKPQAQNANAPKPCMHEVEKAFGIVGAKQQVPGFNTPSARVPRLEPGYRFRKDLLSQFLMWWKLNNNRFKDGMQIIGPCGSGKTSLPEQIFARLNVPLERVEGHVRMELSDLVGYRVPDGSGKFVFSYGPLPRAMKLGRPLLINEADCIPPGTLSGLHGVCEGAALTIPENGGEVVQARPGFAVIMTCNTGGMGDRTGLYQGTLRLNLAYLDRFWKMTVGYMEKEDELEVLRAIPGIQFPDDQLTKFIQTANDIRALHMGANMAAGALEITLSTRTIIRWVEIAWNSQGVRKIGKAPETYALDLALTNGASPETREACLQITRKNFGITK